MTELTPSRLIFMAFHPHRPPISKCRTSQAYTVMTNKKEKRVKKERDRTNGRAITKKGELLEFPFWLSSPEGALILIWSGKRDSNSRPQPWQGCALPTELFPQMFSRFKFKNLAAFLCVHLDNGCVLYGAFSDAQPLIFIFLKFLCQQQHRATRAPPSPGPACAQPLR